MFKILIFVIFLIIIYLLFLNKKKSIGNKYHHSQEKKMEKNSIVKKDHLIKDNEFNKELVKLKKELNKNIKYDLQDESDDLEYCKLFIEIE
tara:strand:+ start:30132 stop:30404 length:273 start_codon:yes stop_codon:yes gene_type:complete